jgi:cytochrome c peroxidase
MGVEAPSRMEPAALRDAHAAMQQSEDVSARPVVPPLGLDLYLPAPSDNPITAEKLALGERLFAEARLSADGRTSCATCHQPERAFTDGRRTARGVFGRTGRRNAPSILNRAYGTAFSWDGRFGTIEDQVQEAIANSQDLGLPVSVAAARLSDDATYVAAFDVAFGAPISQDRLVQAIATFVRGALSGDSPVDRLLAGDAAALSPAARRGYALFNGAARCSRCHAGPLFTDDDFHNTGVSWGRDAGRFEVTGRPEDRGRFKTPTLRDVALTAPYMHDGSIRTLEAVVDFYSRGGGRNPNLDPAIRPLGLSRSERSDLVAFLRALQKGGGGPPVGLPGEAGRAATPVPYTILAFLEDADATSPCRGHARRPRVRRTARPAPRGRHGADPARLQPGLPRRGDGPVPRGAREARSLRPAALEGRDVHREQSADGGGRRLLEDGRGHRQLPPLLRRPRRRPGGTDGNDARSQRAAAVQRAAAHRVGPNHRDRVGLQRTEPSAVRDEIPPQGSYTGAPIGSVSPEV